MTPPVVFYHCACIGNWRDVAREQLDVMNRAGLTDVRAVCLGSRGDARLLSTLGKVEILDISHHALDYETPTLQRLHEHCCQEPTGNVIYCHTKGVSKPLDANAQAWRRLMDHWVLRRWRENCGILEAGRDAVGVNWRNTNGEPPHFSGNVWMARKEWIAGLLSPESFKATRLGQNVCGMAWGRIHAEMWLGSKAGIRQESLVCTNKYLFKGPEVFGYLDEARCGAPVGADAINIVSPFSRPENLDVLQKHLEPMGVKWTLLTGPPYPALPALPTWTTEMRVGQWPSDIPPYVWKIDAFLHSGLIRDDEWYGFMPDDSGYDDNVEAAVRRAPPGSNAVIVSLNRGKRQPPAPAARMYGCSPLTACPENMKPGSVDLLQLFIRGRVLKTLQYPVSAQGDGMLAAEIVKLPNVHYAPTVFGRFNWLEPGRW